MCARQTKKVKTALVSIMALAMLTARGEELAGHYILQGVMEVGSELLLKSDGSFEYMLAYGAADYWGFLRSEAGKPGKICVWVLGKNGHGVENIQVALQTVDQHFEATTTSDGAAVFPDVANARAVAFEVPVYSIKAGPFEIKSSDNDFYFEINGDAITEVLFKDEELAIDGKDLLMKYWNKEKPMLYEKQ